MKCKPNAGMNTLQLFLNENWLDCNENLYMGPLVQVLQVTYYENNSHSLQNAKIA